MKNFKRFTTRRPQVVAKLRELYKRESVYLVTCSSRLIYDVGKKCGLMHVFHIVLYFHYGDINLEEGVEKQNVKGQNRV